MKLTSSQKKKNFLAVPAVPLCLRPVPYKHLPEMMKHTGLGTAPVFMPIIHPFYRRMTITIPLHKKQMQKQIDAASLQAVMAEHYDGCPFVKVKPYGIENDFHLGSV